MKTIHISTGLRKYAAVAAVALLAGVSHMAQAQSVIVGSFDDGNCYPFSCLASDGGTTFQQVYSADAFSLAGISGPISISSISFFKAFAYDEAVAMDKATFEISFSTTTTPVGGLSSVWADNIGEDSAVFGTFDLDGTMPDVLTLTGLSPFTYNPGQGNLLMHVAVSGGPYSEINYNSFFQADYGTSGYVSRLAAFSGNDEGTVYEGGALRTQFNYTVAAPVPEPETYGMLMAGLGLIGFMARRRKQNA